MKRAILLLVTFLIAEIAFATENCEKIATNRPQVYMNILAPAATPEDYQEISASESAVNTLAKRTRGTENLSARDGLNKVIAKLKSGEWETIRQLARQALGQKAVEANLVAEAREQTAPIFVKKVAFNFRAVNDSPGQFSVLHSHDGITYFAHHDEDQRIRVHNEYGKLIWTSPLIPEYAIDNASGLRVTINLLENESGEKRLEFYKIEWIKKIPFIGVFNFEFSTDPGGEAKFLARYPGQYSNLIHTKILPDGKRLFFFQSNSIHPFRMITQDGVLESAHTTPESFAYSPDGTVYFNSWGQDSGPYVLSNGRFKQLARFTSLRSASRGSILLRSDGRLIADHATSSEFFLNALHNDREAFLLPARNAKSSMIETKSGRVLYSRAGDVEQASMQFAEIWDITGKKPILLKVNSALGPGRLDVKLLETSTGAAAIFLTTHTVEMHMIGATESQFFGRAEIKLGSGRSEIITAPSKAFFLQSNKIGSSHGEPFTLIRIYGKE